MIYVNYPQYYNNDLFSSQNNYNYFVITNHHVSKLGRLNDFTDTNGNLHMGLACEIPMGYSNILLNERQAIFNKGKCIWLNTHSISSSNFLALSASKFLVYNDKLELLHKHFSALEDAKQFARQYSKTHDSATMVVSVIANQMWH